MPVVKVIPQKIDPITKSSLESKSKRKVAAYARVSTGSDEQFTSFEAQVDYYTKFIEANPNWELVKVYTDEGISGTSLKRREGFKAMIDDALKGKIDLIVTKSVSRFARNTVDTLTKIRELKANGVEVYFEKENIYTLDTKGEILITIMSSLAQEESRSISENVTWGIRAGFANGKVIMPYKRFLGFKKGEDGRPVIVEEEAETVRLIYLKFIEGMSYLQIADFLNQSKIPMPSKKKDENGDYIYAWRVSTIRSILTNEKYKGEAILQKKFTTDFLTHTSKVNEGEVPQYHVTDSHEAIVSPEEWELAQAEIARREAMKADGKYSGNSIFSSKLVCGDCGCFYGQKVWHSNDPYRKVIFRCNSKFDKRHGKCETPTLTEEQIKGAFVKSYNTLDRAFLIDDAKMAIETLSDDSQINAEIDEASIEMGVILQKAKAMVERNSTEALDQGEYQKRYGALEERHHELEKKMAKLEGEKRRRKALIQRITFLIRSLEGGKQTLGEFDAKLWTLLVEKATVFKEGKIRFRYYAGYENEVEVE